MRHWWLRLFSWWMIGPLHLWSSAMELSFLYTVKICHCDWLNKETDWPIAEQNKVRQESQTENDGKKRGRVRGIARQTEPKQDMLEK